MKNLNNLFENLKSLAEKKKKKTQHIITWFWRICITLYRNNINQTHQIIEWYIGSHRYRKMKNNFKNCLIFRENKIIFNKLERTNYTLH